MFHTAEQLLYFDILDNSYESEDNFVFACNFSGEFPIFTVNSPILPVSMSILGIFHESADNFVFACDFSGEFPIFTMNSPLHHLFLAIQNNFYMDGVNPFFIEY